MENNKKRVLLQFLPINSVFSVFLFLLKTRRSCFYKNPEMVSYNSRLSLLAQEKHHRYLSLTRVFLPMSLFPPFCLKKEKISRIYVHQGFSLFFSCSSKKNSWLIFLHYKCHHSGTATKIRKKKNFHGCRRDPVRLCVYMCESL